MSPPLMASLGVIPLSVISVCAMPEHSIRVLFPAKTIHTGFPILNSLRKKCVFLVTSMFLKDSVQLNSLSDY
ncbi:uncharacterized protein EI90DRAFT_3038528 [Cantharellus anzutake]|uniref:uncharacterized protein n=1 Tax=Cantharellus anzutake TaxID=1750568 RepID=UPI001907087B|nr:uncharacterized protein EI90DRAFT_3038528 [Cantharellus anzutake]KAF8339947.1 hypothetical protein EI90DRAFT_3038528 [Cantharellus anzutake]